MKKLVVIILGFILLMFTGCGTTDEREEADFFRKDEVYKFVFEDDVLFYGLTTQEEDEEYDDRVVSYIIPTDWMVDEYLHDYSSVEDLEAYFDGLSPSDFVFDNHIFWAFLLTVEDDKLILTDTKGDDSNKTEFIVEQEADGTKFYYEDFPNEKGDVIKTTKEELYESLVQRKSLLENLTLETPFDFDGGTLVVKDAIEKEVVASSQGDFNAIKIPIEITNTLSSEFELVNFATAIDAYNSNGEPIQNLDRFYDDYDGAFDTTFHGMSSDPIAPGETVTTYVILEEDPSGEYQLVVHNQVIRRVVNFTFE